MKKWKKLYSITGTFVCPYCLKEYPLEQATREHEPPLSRQKELGKSTVILACAKCNHEKGALSASEYAEWKRLNAIRNGNQKG